MLFKEMGSSSKCVGQATWAFKFGCTGALLALPGATQAAEKLSVLAIAGAESDASFSHPAAARKLQQAPVEPPSLGYCVPTQFGVTSPCSLVCLTPGSSLWLLFHVQQKRLFVSPGTVQMQTQMTIVLLVVELWGGRGRGEGVGGGGAAICKSSQWSYGAICQNSQISLRPEGGRMVF